MGIRVDSRLIATFAVVVAIVALAGSRRADAAVYWGSSVDGVGAANLDGSDPMGLHVLAAVSESMEHTGRNSA